MGLADGRYRPGQPLGEVGLARAHRASRTPIREALARLEAEGYVERVPRRGYFAARIGPRAVQDLMDVRRAVEGLTAARAAQVAGETELETLRRLAAFTYPESGRAGYRRAERANRKFHLALAEASHNRLALEIVARCLAHMDRFIALGMTFAPFPRGARREHEAIVAAVARHDAAGARRAMERHLDRTEGLVRRALERGELAHVNV